ncbi:MULTISPECIES: MgtC/SapB family protein [Chryseobacterium]|uniref:Mg2+ transporter-C (MgtC) family protein n=1 Tax=Chryseobacterium camelliae TaxID=1265445 RepID=A0ABU0TJI6_9FLAO|nr:MULTISPECIES: MgtC/SapB family protein [Chryseobacterium]MDT3408947.1 putative Mg2+ transporter-C (MgtC) family protein [Pseudacidovorax intermedius]MDQ1097197.1 putative Mg2+ transporter-C (MgtC) family protein [Chryseobacterium camelliae]MDQ1101133.1 putative Mg2+ transporter-C (MgtC) family protein [Chryseobacterium sp. SORGH_AS_1048]MDR6084578.1 putative Mg2+ transporter-C (MgtC) family protein [Chryseobacterium sp. SORGH_AS_0909]MDR6132847.1 putative Mg2+ transporter-C (MgtC) family pr
MKILPEHSVENELLLIFISVLLGLLIGAEREYRNKSAGLRTFILVCFGACLFTILSVVIGVDDPDRIAANIITGIGFLGAGVIFKGDNKIDGITTATTIWATASIGMAVGAGHIYIALLGTLLVLLVLSMLTYMEKLIDKNHKITEYRITVSHPEDLRYCEQVFEHHHLKASISKQKYSHGTFSITWIITGKKRSHELLIKVLKNNSRIISYEF